MKKLVTSSYGAAAHDLMKKLVTSSYAAAATDLKKKPRFEL